MNTNFSIKLGLRRGQTQQHRDRNFVREDFRASGHSRRHRVVHWGTPEHHLDWSGVLSAPQNRLRIEVPITYLPSFNA